jgi:LPS-assembly protein
LTAKGRFDVDTFQPRRIDVGVSSNLGPLTGSVSYANYEAQPVIGYYVRREGLSLNSRYNITDNYFVQGNVTFDMSRHLYPIALTGYTTPSLFSVANLGISAGYHDECCTLTANFTSNYYDSGTGSLSHTNIFLLELQLRTLGDFKFSQTLSSIAGMDGL